MRGQQIRQFCFYARIKTTTIFYARIKNQHFFMREQQIQQYFTTCVFLGASYAKRLQRKQPQETHMLHSRGNEGDCLW